jgi:hypothetical protein
LGLGGWDWAVRDWVVRVAWFGVAYFAVSYRVAGYSRAASAVFRGSDAAGPWFVARVSGPAVRLNLRME